MTLRVLMNVGPWLPVPPRGYGGIENMVAALVPELRRRGVHVVLATVGSSTLPADERLSVFDEGQFAALLRPYNQVMGVAHAHLQRVAAVLRDRGDIDLVHDHVEVVGLSVFAAMGRDAPPVLHTLHWDLTKHAELYGGFDGCGRVFVNGVSAAQLARAPAALRRHSLGHVHLATPLAVGADRVPQPAKKDHVVVLGRVSPGKGQHVAVRLAHRLGIRMVLAGPVGPYHRPEDLHRALDTDPSAVVNPDVRYWLDEVSPGVDGRLVRWVGTLRGSERDKLVSTARAALFPLQWDEPGGTAVVESLALGTPVVGLRRGCLPELVRHGSTGLLAVDEEELAELLPRADDIEPGRCRQVAAERFTPAVMAEHYLRLYWQVLARSRPRLALLAR